MLFFKFIYKLFIQDRFFVISKKSLHFKHLCFYLRHKEFNSNKINLKNFLNKNSNRAYYFKFGLNRFNIKKYIYLGFLPLNKK